MDNYFSMRQRIINGNLYDSLKSGNEQEDSVSKDNSVSAEVESSSTPVETDSPEFVPSSEPTDDVSLVNSYQGSDDDDDISSFEKQIGKSIIPNAVIVPPSEDVTEEPSVEEKSVVDFEESEPVQRQTKPYVPPKSDHKIKINYDAEKKNGISFSNLKSVPTDLVAMAEQYFPSASNKMDAVAAYIYVKEGCSDDMNVPDGIKELAKEYQGETTTAADLEKSIAGSLRDFRAYVQRQMRDLSERVYTIEMLIGYSLFDQLEFRQKNAPTPSDVDFYETGLADLIKHAEKEADKQRKKAEYDNNRPY